ncbi:MAG: hypothetical protein KC433_15265, partial [Anaerolineales bacterium]|nr:hypothetical protein [Anaerolineales bacterium]
MISFEIPESIVNQAQMTKMVAEQAMRPFSRDLDEHEHQRPETFVNMTWPFTQQMMKSALKGVEKRLNGNGNGTNGANGHSAPKGPDFSILGFIM